MKKTRKELKISARASLLGHYKTVITALLFSQLAALLLNIPFQRMAQQGILYMVPSRIALGVLGSILVFLLSSLLQIGVSQIHLQIARKQETRLEHLFFAFRNNPDRFLGIQRRSFGRRPDLPVSGSPAADAPFIRGYGLSSSP